MSICRESVLTIFKYNKRKEKKVKEEQEYMLDIYGQLIPVKYIFNSEKKDKRYYEKLRREERRKNGINKKK